eukprot:CAMPEP_0114548384 /NCGR_PEP_ID=MMETSP0114-20121206/4951_1 /TAXON_ID=31324 /ORGANISM="Goniomonas sp, Strain m" /LENGTH=1680 /DNA_ID=CAMNT_0001732967 /DNA_START=11 /DNA_END=5053 /DNA_ORIENTATION=-
MKSPIAVVASLLLVALTGSFGLNLGTAGVSDLRDTKICYWGKICGFTADCTIQLKEKAETAAGLAKTSSARLDLALDFNVTSQCGSDKHQFYRLDVTEFFGGEDDQSAVQDITRFPVFFSQRRSDGKIENVYTSTREKKSLARFKHGLITSLAKQVHHSALEKIGSDAKEVTYAFEGEDPSGPFVAKHTLKHDQKSGGIVLVESITYDDHDSKSYQKKVATSHHFRIGGQVMKIEQTKTTKTFLQKDGRASRIRSKDSLKVGSNKPLGLKPAQPTPSAGQQMFKVSYDVSRLGEGVVPTPCKGDTTLAEFENDIQELLGGAHARSLRQPFSEEEMETDEEEMDPGETLLKAEDVLSNGEFDFDEVAPLMSKTTAHLVTNHAWKLFHQGSLDVEAMKKVLGALTGTRSPEAYDELLKVLKDKTAHMELREQAVVSLIHANHERPPPAYVVNSVAEVSKSSDPIANQATLLLGALLETRPESDMDAVSQLQSLEQELNSMDPTNVGTADRAVTLLGALGNARAVGATKNVLHFLDSPVEKVRVAAVEAIREMRNANQPATAPADSDNGIIMLEDFLEDEADPEVETYSFLAESMGESRDFLDQASSIAGNKNTELKARSKVGAKWSDASAGVYGTTTLHAKMYKYRTPVMEVGYNGGVAKAATGGNIGGLDMYVNIVGKRVLARKYDFENQDLHVGGVCPKDVFSAPGSQRRPAQMWYRSLFKFKAPFTVGPVPMSVSVELSGGVGYQMLLAGYANCKSDAKINDMVIVGGASPHGKFSIITKAAVDVWVASAGVEGSTLLMSGNLPAYSLASTSKACGHLDYEPGTLSGNIDLFAQVAQNRVNKNLVSWQGSSVRKSLLSNCGGVTLGEFLQASPAAAAAATPAETVVPAQATQAKRTSIFTSAASGSGHGAQAEDLLEESVSEGQEQTVESSSIHDSLHAATHALIKHARATGGLLLDGAALAGGALPQGWKRAEAAARQAKDEMVHQGAETRKIVRHGGERNRDTTRHGGEEARSVVRRSNRRVDEQVEEGGAEARHLVRSSATRDRDTTRRAATETEEVAFEEAGQQRRQTRRAEQREEGEVNGNRKASRREVEELQHEMKEMEDKEDTERMRKMFRRQIDRVVEAEESDKEMLERKADRDRLRRAEDKEKERTKDIESDLKAEELQKAERRQMKRVRQQSERNFEKLDQEENFKEVRSQVRRSADKKDFERRHFDQVQDQIRRTDSDEKSRERLDREEQRIEQATDRQKEMLHDVEEVNQDVRRSNSRERRGSRRMKKDLEGDFRRTASRNDERDEMKSVRDQARRNAEREAQREDEEAVEETVRENAERNRRQTRDAARETDGTVRQTADEQEAERQATETQETAREASREERETQREADRQVEGTIEAEQDSDTQARRFAGFDKELETADEQQGERAREQREAQREAGTRQREELQEWSNEESQQQREADAKVEGVEERGEERQKEDLARYGSEREASFARAEARTDRQNRNVRRNMRDMNKHWETEQKHVSNRMSRMSARDRRRADKQTKHFARRMSRLQAREVTDEEAAKNTLVRQLARRSDRTSKRFARVTKRTTERFERTKQSINERIARESGRVGAEFAQQQAHEQNRLARLEGRANTNTAQLNTDFSGRMTRTENRDDNELARTNQRFGLRTGRSEQRFAAMIPHAGGN